MVSGHVLGNLFLLFIIPYLGDFDSAKMKISYFIYIPCTGTPKKMHRLTLITTLIDPSPTNDHRAER